jgi:hypothetical protein
MQLAHYLGMLHRAEQDFGAGLRHIARAHAAEVDVHHTALLLAAQCDQHVQRLQPFAERYGDEAPAEPDHLYADLFLGPRTGGLGLLRDLHDLYLLASSCDISWTMIGQAAKAARDEPLDATVKACAAETARHLQWLKSRMKTAAPQALVVA